MSSVEKATNVAEPIEQAIEKVEARALSTSLSDLFQEDAGAGMAKGANDYAVPFITILQKGSPQVSKANPKFLKGAEPGAIMNTVTQDVYRGDSGPDSPGGILYVPCGYQKQLVRWKPRDSGGGLVCHYAENDPALKKFSRNQRGQLTDLETQDIIVDTAYHFGLLLHDGGFPEFAVISMYSTQLKKSRMWNTVMRRIMKRGSSGNIFNPPSYSHVYRLTTLGESKDSYDWYGWNIVSEGEVQDVEIYKVARDFSKQVESGNVRVSAPPQDFDEPVEKGDEGIPF